jgi:ribose transport system substrate-binding protein
MSNKRRLTTLCAAVALPALACGPMAALAQEETGTKTAHELRADYDKNIKGKTIAFLPIATGVPLMDEWGTVIKTEAEWSGMKFTIRDPNNNPSAMQQALTALVDEKPDVIVVQNPSVRCCRRS